MRQGDGHKNVTSKSKRDNIFMEGRARDFGDALSYCSACVRYSKLPLN